MKNLQKGFTLIELMIVIAIIGILAAIAIPQYQNYIARTQVSRVMAETGQYKTAYEYCTSNGRTGSVNSNAAAATPVGATDCVLDMTGSNLVLGGLQGFGTIPAGGTGYPQAVMAATGVGTLESTFGNNAGTALTGQTLTWSRDAEGTWSCATTVEPKYRPNGCM